jgi:hypothetical protein
MGDWRRPRRMDAKRRTLASTHSCVASDVHKHLNEATCRSGGELNRICARMHEDQTVQRDIRQEHIPGAALGLVWNYPPTAAWFVGHQPTARTPSRLAQHKGFNVVMRSDWAANADQDRGRTVEELERLLNEAHETETPTRNCSKSSADRRLICSPCWMQWQKVQRGCVVRRMLRFFVSMVIAFEWSRLLTTTGVGWVRARHTH